MQRKLFNRIFLMILFVNFLIIASPVGVHAQAQADDPLKSIKSQAQGTLNQLPATSTPQTIIGLGIRFLTMFMGSIMFVLVVYAGIMFMTAQGNAERVEKAKNIMVWATLGVAVMLLSYIVVSFIFTSIQTGA